MALRRCLGGCGALINSGSYCPRCRPRNGSSRRWRTLREGVLQRDRGVCWICGRAGADTVDHITPISAGGTDDPANLSAAHKRCNLAKGARY